MKHEVSTLDLLLLAALSACCTVFGIFLASTLTGEEEKPKQPVEQVYRVVVDHTGEACK